MTTETVTVNLGQGRKVGVQAETRYLGTRPRCGANIEDYAVTIRGIQVEGTWDGDGRSNVTVEDCPDGLVELLLPTWEAQEKARYRRDLAETQEHERNFYGRVLTHG